MASALGWAEADVTVPRMLETALKFSGHPRDEHTVGGDDEIEKVSQDKPCAAQLLCWECLNTTCSEERLVE